MCLAPLLLVGMLGLGPEPEPEAAALVARLGSARWADREAAAVALERLGRAALPALRAARQAKDPEVQTRAAALLERIESGLMVKPTLVRLDYRDRPLTEVIRDLSEQSGMALVLDADSSPRLAARRLTLEEAEPLPFWEALDRLCQAGGLRHDLGTHELPGGRGMVLGVGLTEAPALPLQQGPTCDRGPFRIKLVRVRYERDRLLDLGPGDPADAASAEQFQVQMMILAEPRLMIGQYGHLRLTEAVDDRGNSLLPALPPLLGAQGDEDTPLIEFSPGATLQMPILLRYPKEPGQTIRRLCGTVPVAVASRKADPLVIPLLGAAGKTFRQGDLALTIHAVRAEANEPQVTVELSVRTGTDDGERASRPLHSIPLVPEFLEQQIEVVDAHNRPYVTFPQETAIQAGALRITLMLAPGDGATAPAQLRYYGLTRAMTEVAFEFADIPMP
ncbi:MAG: hypothetical protein IRY99_12195 [Isosphaeraceae bacterium]|nr:hypothetical protein [Isosphaeraceae bacterium]